jgi:transcriptional regulator with XRE-family HTH domain
MSHKKTKKSQKTKDLRGRPKVGSDEQRKIARRLRIEEKKTLREIADIIGVSKTTLQRWSKEEDWPNPRVEVREFRGIFKVKEKAGGTKKPEKSEARTPEVILPDDMGDIDFDAPIDNMVEDLFRWCCKAAHQSAKINTRTQLELARITAKVMLGKKEQGPQRELTVYTPQKTESYRGRPDEE